MITNLPKPKEYMTLGIEWLYQALGIIVSEFQFEENEIKKKVNTELFTAQFLLFQSLECYLKWKVSLKSIYLLFDTSNNLPTLHTSKSKDFNDLYMHSPDTLLRIYTGIYGANKDMEQLFLNMKKARNEIVHSIHRDKISIKDLCKTMYELSKLYGINLWQNNWERNFEEEILSDVYYYSRELELFTSNFSKKQLTDIFGPGKISARCSDDCSPEEQKTIFFPADGSSGYCVCCRREYNQVIGKCKECNTNSIILQSRSGDIYCWNCGEPRSSIQN